VLRRAPLICRANRTRPSPRGPSTRSGGPTLYDVGTATNGFGGGRNHQGPDVLAARGLRVLAAQSGTVAWAKWDDAAGNYAVVEAADGSSQGYMHMRDRAVVRRGDAVAAGP
jgi:murein DD-endopeptidase MepM/ murein hydrolase activator NlpD